MLGNTALDAALNAQFLVQIGVFTAVPMIMGFILEMGLLKVGDVFIAFRCSCGTGTLNMFKVIVQIRKNEGGKVRRKIDRVYLTAMFIVQIGFLSGIMFEAYPLRLWQSLC